MLGDIQDAVRAHAHAVGNLEIDAGGETFDLLGVAVLIAVGNRPDIGLARADEHGADIAANRHVPGVRHDRVNIDLEAGRQLDLFQVLAELLDLRRVLRNGLQRQVGSGRAEVLQSVEVFLRQRRAGSQSCTKQKAANKDP